MIKTIYAIDDDPDVMAVVLFRLKLAHFEVTGFTSSSVALRAIDQTPPDLILLDLEMGEISGWHMLEILHDHQKTKHIPVIVMSGHTDIETKRFKKFNVVGYVTKPIDFNPLIESIDSLQLKNPL